MSPFSKSIGIALLILVALLLTPGRPAAAETYVPATLFSQPPDPAGGLYQSSWWSPNESNFDKYLWDNFTLTTTQDITGIQWRGGYDPNVFNGAGAVVDFEVAIYASNGAEPAYLSPLVTYPTGGNAGQTYAETVGIVDMYDYSFTLPTPFQAQGGTKYWVFIVAKQTGNPDWGLSKGTGGDTQHFRINHDGSVIEFRSGDLTFTLMGPDGMVYGLAISDPPYELGGLSLDFSDLGTDLDCVKVTNVPINHPNATTGIQTGQYWTLEGLQSDCVNPTTITDYTFDITLPHNNISPDTNAKVCKYPGNLGGAGWDCDRSGSDATNVWRNGINSGFSDWAVGNNVTPTALTLNSFSASSTGERTALAALLFAACAALLFTWKIWRNRQLE